jgi:hypothetical protein
MRASPPSGLLVTSVLVVSLTGCVAHTVLDASTFPTTRQSEGQSIDAQTLGGEHVDLRFQRVEVVSLDPGRPTLVLQDLVALYADAEGRRAVIANGDQWTLPLDSSRFELVRPDRVATGCLIGGVVLLVVGVVIGAVLGADAIHNAIHWGGRI